MSKTVGVLAFKLFPAAGSASVTASRHQCELGATVILLAAERHRRRTGEWPASIAAMDRTILPTEPLDPYSGRSFRMARRDGQLFVYSIGPNRKDQGGTYDRANRFENQDDDFGASLWDVQLPGGLPGARTRRPPKPGPHHEPLH